MRLPRDIVMEDWSEENRLFWNMLEDFERSQGADTRCGRRKLRLVACGCCRLIWPHLHDPRLRQAVEVSERYADVNATAKELRAATEAAKSTNPRTSQGFLEDDPYAQANTLVALVVATTHPIARSAAYGMCGYSLPLAGYRGPESEAFALMCDLLRDIFGNPFRPAAFSPSWRTSTAVAIAKGMYESRDFRAMPILADALQDAGCDNDDVLNHCRDAKQVHVRGCWVVDLVLCKG
jgi:hypothetical protein